MKKILPFALLGSLGLVTTANAQFAAVGLPDPVSHFPISVTDSTGQQLTMCVNSPLCPPPNIIATNPFSVATGFGAEGFYNNGTAKINNNNLLVLALEAGYIPVGNPVDGNQNVFGRIRVRADVPGPGTYLVTHPWAPTCAPVRYTGCSILPTCVWYPTDCLI